MQGEIRDLQIFLNTIEPLSHRDVLTILIQNFDASDGDEIIVSGQTTGTVLYSLVGTDDVEVQATNGTATITFTIEDTTISALTSSHYNSGTGLVIS